MAKFCVPASFPELNRKCANCLTSPAKFWRQEHRTRSKGAATSHQWEHSFQDFQRCFSAYGEGSRGADAIGRHTRSNSGSTWVCVMYISNISAFDQPCYPRIALNLFPGQMLDEMRHEEVLLAAWIYQEVFWSAIRYGVFTPWHVDFSTTSILARFSPRSQITGSSSTLFPFNEAQTLPACWVDFILRQSSWFSAWLWPSSSSACSSPS